MTPDALLIALINKFQVSQAISVVATLDQHHSSSALCRRNAVPQSV
jgi:hypothetical protein